MYNPGWAIVIQNQFRDLVASQHIGLYCAFADLSFESKLVRLTLLETQHSSDLPSCRAKGRTGFVCTGAHIADEMDGAHGLNRQISPVI